MLRGNHAVRLGLRAASRNPELAFAKALLDQGGNLLALLPIAIAAALIASANFGRVVRALAALGWATTGAVLAAVALAAAVTAAFWAGALPLLAADAEMNRRPPSGHFLALLARGAVRTIVAAVAGWGLALSFALCCAAALAWAVPIAAARPSPGTLAALALLCAAALVGGVLLDVLARLVLIRAAAFGESASAAFGKAASLLGARLGGCLIVTAAFVFLELIAATVAGLFTGLLPGEAFDLRAELIGLAPRIAAGLAFAAVFAWLEVGRMGALAALAADAEGLIETPEQPEPPVAELVVEALPAEDEPAPPTEPA
jgi:hypothetical protein